MIIIDKLLRQKCYQCNLTLGFIQTDTHSKIYCKGCEIAVMGSTPEEAAIHWIQRAIKENEWLKLVAEHEEKKEKKLLEYLDKLTYGQFFDKMKGVFNDIHV